MRSVTQFAERVQTLGTPKFPANNLQPDSREAFTFSKFEKSRIF